MQCSKCRWNEIIEGGTLDSKHVCMNKDSVCCMNTFSEAEGNRIGCDRGEAKESHED